VNPETASLHPSLARMASGTGFAVLGAAELDAWAAAPGRALLFFSEDPALHRETLDLAVIVPELARTFAGRFRTALLPPDAARAAAPRYGFRRWPALVVLDGGRYVGAIDGLRNWAEYHAELERLLDAPASRPPAVGIPIRTERT
jgi:hydrogenase-1 operon protein HyaE